VLFAALGAAAAAYLGAAALLGAPELRTLRNAVRRRRG
jgi:hypothetical protein